MIEPVNEEEEVQKKGCLYLVSTPIGNWDDMTLRGIKILKNCDKVVCEEPKEGARILKQYNVYKDIELLNEQNEGEMSQELIYELTQGKRIALISDCGTPVFADPGYDLVKACLRRNIDIVVVPGASSIMAGVVRSGFGIKQFLFAGFLSRMKEEREEQMKLLSYERRTVVLLETPYRLMPFLEAARDILPYRNAYIGCNLTMPYETHHYGTFLDLYKKFKDMRFKGEFIVIFEGLPLDTKYDEGWKPYGSDKPEYDGMERPRRTDSRSGFSQGGKPFKRDDRGSSRPYNNDRRSSGDRPYNKDRKDGGDRPYNKDRKEGGDRPYNKDRKEGGDRPYNKDRKEGGDRPYNKDRKEGGDRRPYNKDKKEGGDKPYNKDRKSGGDRPYNKDKKDGGGKPFNKDRKSGGDRPRSNDKKYEKKPFKKRDN